MLALPRATHNREVTIVAEATLTAARWLAASTLLDTTTCVLPNVDTPVSMNLGHGVVWVPQIVTRIRIKLKECVSSRFHSDCCS